MSLTPTQREILAAAAERPDRSLHPLPERLTGGRAKKTVEALLARGLAETGPDGTVCASDAGLAALSGQQAQEHQDREQDAQGAAGTRVPREGTKQAALIGMLRADGGATIAEMAEATGWAPHTVRGALSGALKKRLGLAVRSETVEGRGRVYVLDA